MAAEQVSLELTLEDAGAISQLDLFTAAEQRAALMANEMAESWAQVDAASVRMQAGLQGVRDKALQHVQAQAAVAQANITGATAVQRMGGELGQLGSHFSGLAPAIQTAHTHITNFANTMETKVVSAVRNLGGQIMNLVSNPLKLLVSGLGLIGVGFAIDQIVTKTELWYRQIGSLTTLLQGNATMASTMLAVFDRLGVTADQLSARYGQLIRRMENMPSDFARFGLATMDLHGHLKSLDEFLPELMDKVNQLRGSTEQAYLAETAFGRSMGSFAAAFIQASENWKLLADEAKKYGLVLDDNMLAANLRLQSQMRVVQQEFRGFFMMLGTQLMPVVVQVGGAIGTWLVQNVDILRNAIQNVVAWIMTFISALTGAKLEISAGSEALAAYAVAAGDSAAADEAGVIPKNSMKNALKDQTAAMQEQIRVIQDNQQAFDKSMEDQKTQYDRAADAQKQATDRSIDSQLEQLRVTQQEYDWENQLNDLRERVAGDQTAIQRDQLKLSQELFDGRLDSAITTNNSMLDAQQKLRDDQDKIIQDQAKRNTTLQEQALQDRKRDFDQSMADTKKSYDEMLDDTKRARDDAYKAQLDQLQDAVSRVRAAATDEATAMERSAQDMTASMNGFAVKMYHDIKDKADGSESRIRSMSTDMSGSFMAVQKSATDAANDMKKAWDAFSTTLGGIAKTLGAIKDIFDWMNSHTPDWLQSYMDKVNKNNDPLGTLFDQFFGQSSPPGSPLGQPSSTPQGQLGAVAWPNMPILVGERGPEIFVPSTSGDIMSNDSMGGLTGGGSITATFNIYDATDANRVAQVVNQELSNLMARVSS